MDALARAATRHEGHVLIVRYEHLVNDADGFQRDLFAWLGETPLEHLPNAVSINPAAPPSEAERMYGAITAEPRPVAGLVSEAEAAQLQTLVRGAMSVLGYQPMDAR